jgi:uncharacterized damage-inducible protein DinB
MTSDHVETSALRALFAQKAWSNDELFAKLATLDAAAHPAEAHNALRILNHIHVVDTIFRAHLSGQPHGHQATNTPETPSLETLAAAVKATDAWFVDYVSGLSASALQERVRFTFTDGDAGLMSREEILLHVITHGGYHRGAVGQVMRSVGVAPPRDLYTRFLHLTEPGRRSA